MLNHVALLHHFPTLLSLFQRVLVLLFFLLHKCQCLQNGLALTPPMGWLSWTRFQCQTDCRRFPKSCIRCAKAMPKCQLKCAASSERLFLEMSDALISNGYSDAGYRFVNVDDCWTGKNRESGQLTADADRFPHGIKWLAEQIHSKGLMFGIYTNLGPRTCMGYSGTEMYNIEVDARTFADFGADYLKFDGCFQEENQLDKAYPLMGRSLNLTGRPIIYACSWPYYTLSAGKKLPDYNKVANHCNLWRNFDDIYIDWISILSIIDFYDAHQDEFSQFHGPGRWNDPDMLIIGNPGITLDQSLVQMALWCLWSAPLLMSNDLRAMQPGTKEILLNRRLLAVDQDPLAIMGRKFHTVVHFLIVFVVFIGIFSTAMLVSIVNQCIRSSEIDIQRFLSFSIEPNRPIGL